MQTLHVKTDRRTQLVDVTAQVQKAVASSGVASGICYLYVPHTTAAITINECADPDVARDVEGALDRLIPAAGPYRHSEGNSDSHVKSVLVGASQIIHVEGGKLVLGTGRAYSSASLMVRATGGFRIGVSGLESTLAGISLSAVMGI